MLGWILVFSLMSLVAGAELVLAAFAPNSGLIATMFFGGLSLLCILANATSRKA